MFKIFLIVEGWKSWAEKKPIQTGHRSQISYLQSKNEEWQDYQKNKQIT